MAGNKLMATFMGRGGNSAKSKRDGGFGPELKKHMKERVLLTLKLINCCLSKQRKHQETVTMLCFFWMQFSISLMQRTKDVATFCSAVNFGCPVGQRENSSSHRKKRTSSRLTVPKQIHFEAIIRHSFEQKPKDCEM